VCCGVVKLKRAEPRGIADPYGIIIPVGSTNTSLPAAPLM